MGRLRVDSGIFMDETDKSEQEFNLNGGHLALDNEQCKQETLKKSNPPCTKLNLFFIDFTHVTSKFLIYV